MAPQTLQRRLPQLAWRPRLALFERMAVAQIRITISTTLTRSRCPLEILPATAQRLHPSATPTAQPHPATATSAAPVRALHLRRHHRLVHQQPRIRRRLLPQLQRPSSADHNPHRGREHRHVGCRRTIHRHRACVGRLEPRFVVLASHGAIPAHLELHQQQVRDRDSAACRRSPAARLRFRIASSVPNPLRQHH